MEHLLLFFEIILVNMVLSGDNAIVIAMASRNLPERQRKAAVWWGAGGAVFLRIVLTAGAVYLLQVPFIQAGGSLLLMYIAIKLLLDEEDGPQVKSATTLRSAIWTIVVADLIMSLDNVLAIAAIADGNTLLLIGGIAISIPLIIWGSEFVYKLLNRHPILIYIGAGILGYTAGEMLLSDQIVQQIFHKAHASIERVIPISFTVIVIVAGWLAHRLNRSDARA